MILVGTAIAASTVMFQTITNNRILTVDHGFDLYMLIQTPGVLPRSASLFSLTANPLSSRPP